jgi:hypothetical protein
LSAKSWARFDGWNWTCATSSLQGNVFFGDSSGKVWLYGSDSYPIYADRQGDSSINDGDGETIEFDWELPWTDFKDRSKSKKSKYIHIDCVGIAPFTIKMYTDRIRYNDELEDTPQLEMEMYGGDVEGFGGSGVVMGGGRDTSDEKLYSWPANFKLAKLRITGEVTTRLEFVAITILHQEGSVYR